MALQTIYLSTYKNYHNRNINKYATIQGYSPTITYTLPNTNFNPNDGVNARHVFNMPENTKVSYAIITDTSNQIISRWYVIECIRTLSGQYEATFHRDLLTDYLDQLLDAPMFVERALLRDNDPMIFNNEGLTFNQIKKSEILLKDKTECPWIVGYYSKKGDTEGSTSKLEGTTKNQTEPDILLNTSITDWEFYKYTSENFISKPYQIDHIIRARYYAGGYSATEYTLNYESISSQIIAEIKGFSYADKDDVPTNEQMKSKFDSDVILQLDLYAKGEIPWADTPQHEFKKLDGQIIQSNENGVITKYRIRVHNYRAVKTIKNTVTKNGQYYTLINNLMKTFPGYNGVDDNPISLAIYSINYRLELEDITTGLEYAIPEDRFQCNDAPYDIFAIPYGAVDLIDSPIQFTSQADAAFAVANSIAEKYSGTYLYDLQILPYCPLPGIINSAGSRVIMPTSKRQYSLVKDSAGNNVTFILNVSYSQFTTNIVLKDPIRIKNPKIESQTDTYRLVSPNYNGQFQFNAAKMDGVEYFNVDCTYKPYCPYIHLNPNFKGLYGDDYNDARGLVCGGDFSMATITDQWKQYEINNKNYLNTFNRQIENMEVNNRLNNLREAVNIGTSAIQGGVLGAISGSKTMAALSAGTSLIKGAVNLGFNKAQQKEAIDLAKDQFEYSMGNIEALPYALNRVSAYTANNKFFPFLEYYTCTPEEREALVQKIKYRGMTVGRIGTLREFWGYSNGRKTFYQARLIICDIEEDDQLISEIANELSMGIYFGG